MKLQIAWNARLKLRADGDKLWAEGTKLWAEGDKLWDEGDKLWAEAIIKVHGNIKLEWKWRGNALDCELGTGEVFRGDAPLDEAA